VKCFEFFKVVFLFAGTTPAFYIGNTILSSCKYHDFCHPYGSSKVSVSCFLVIVTNVLRPFVNDLNGFVFMLTFFRDYLIYRNLQVLRIMSHQFLIAQIRQHTSKPGFEYVVVSRIIKLSENPTNYLIKFKNI
jgi:hypothetical protein